MNNETPTKDNLVHPGFGNLNSLLCVCDRGKEESTQHLFFDCSIFGDLWIGVLKWLGVSSAYPNNALQHTHYFCGFFSGCKSVHDKLYVI